MAKRKVRKVSAMRINEVSLVDFPANAGSQVVLMKRGTPPAGGSHDNPEDFDMKTLEELAKALEDANAEIETLTKRAEDAEKQAEEAVAKAAEADEKLAKAAEGEPGEDDVLKALPEPVRKQFAEMQASNKAMEEQLAKAAEEKAKDEWITKAAALGNLTGTAEEHGAILYRVSKGLTTAEDADTILKILSGANAAAEAVMAENGKTVVKAGSAIAQAEQLASEIIQKSEPPMTRAQALSKVWNDRPDLYTRYEAEQRGAA